MKKNITINLCGRLFNIDEDAYELLNNYIETLRNYFRREEGGDEIADDIEERIAELLDELKASGVEAVNIDHVKEIISRIGQPEQMEGEDEGGEGDAHYQSAYHEPAGHKGVEAAKAFFKNRRLYRNPKDKMLAGVISGLASSFEVEATQLRLAVVAGIVVLSMLGSVFGSYSFLMLLDFRVCLVFLGCYIILALIMPEAETPEQQLKMRGKPVNMASLGNEVVQGADEQTDRPKHRSVLRGAINGLMHFFAACFKVFLGLLAFGLFCMGVVVIVWSILAIYFPENTPYFFDWYTAKILDGNMPLFVGFLVALLLALFIPAYGIVHSLVSRMSVVQRIVAILAWGVATVTAVLTGVLLTQISDKWWRDYHTEQRDAEVMVNDSVAVKLDEYQFLTDHGWRIVNAEGCNGRFTARGEYYVASRRNSRYLDCFDEQHRQRYRVERTDTLMPGKYNLNVAARANGTGAFVYLVVDGKKKLIEIPATGNTGGSIWQNAKEALANGDDSYRGMARANNGKGYGWNSLVFENVEIAKPNTVVSYGLTSDPAFTGQTWLGQWFSACDFEWRQVFD